MGNTVMLFLWESLQTSIDDCNEEKIPEIEED